MRHLILHIGFHKTGTTSVQVALKANAANLRRMGIDVLPDYSDSAGGHHRLVGHESHTLEELWSVLGTLDPNIDYVITSEQMCLWPKDHVTKLNSILDTHQLQIVAFVRPQSEAIPSAYATFVEHYGYADDLVNFMTSNGGMFDYASHLQHWQTNCGNQRLWLRRYNHTTALEDFFDLLGRITGKAGTNLEIPERRNVSLPAGLVRVLRLLNNSAVQDERIRQGLLANWPKEGAYPSTPLVSNYLSGQITSRYAHCNQILHSEFAINLDSDPSSSRPVNGTDVATPEDVTTAFQALLR